MLFKLFLAFTVIPAVELYLLIEIGSQLGALTTIGIVIGNPGCTLKLLSNSQLTWKARDESNLRWTHYPDFFYINLRF